MALADDVKNLVLFSFSLDAERKQGIIARIEQLDDEQLMKLQTIFLDEEKRKNNIIQEAVAKNPELAPKIEGMVKENMNALYKELETNEKPLEEGELDKILGQLE